MANNQDKGGNQAMLTPVRAATPRVPGSKAVKARAVACRTSNNRVITSQAEARRQDEQGLGPFQ